MRRSSLFFLALLTGSFASAQPKLAKATAHEWVDANAETLKRMNQSIWSYAETGLDERRSAKELIDLLKANGFEVEEGVAGMPTAFVATYGSGRPVIGVLAEYDALPGLSQDKVPERQERSNVSAGHGCGHSVFGTASTGAAIAVKQALAAGGIPGTIKLYGTPAEETGIGKTYMLREGYFRDDDVILSWHASPVTASGYGYSKANVSVKFHFKGLPAHASASPYEGRSALDAVELMSVGVNYMREHVKEDARIHYVVTNGGGQPNVVPPDGEVWYYIRANKHRDVEDYFEWVNEIARAAAAMSRTELVSVQVDADMHEVLPNRALSEVIAGEPPARRCAPLHRGGKGLRPPDPGGSPAETGARALGDDRASGRRARARRRLDGRGRHQLVRPRRPAHRRHLQLGCPRAQLADRGLHRDLHRGERDARRCQGARGHRPGSLRFARARHESKGRLRGDTGAPRLRDANPRGAKGSDDDSLTPMRRFGLGASISGSLAGSQAQRT